MFGQVNQISNEILAMNIPSASAAKIVLKKRVIRDIVVFDFYWF